MARGGKEKGGRRIDIAAQAATPAAGACLPQAGCWLNEAVDRQECLSY